MPTSSNWNISQLTLSRNQINKLCVNLSFAVFFDSGESHNNARYDIFSAEPINTLKLDATDKQTLLNKIAYFQKAELCLLKESNSTKPSKLKLPFTNGIIGFLSYQAGETLQFRESSLKTVSKMSNNNCPSVFLGHYTWSYIYDHKLKKGYLSFSPLCNLSLRQKIHEIIASSDTQKQINPDKALDNLEWRKNQSYKEYAEQFDKIKTYINAGDCYQVNLTQRFESKSDISASTLYFNTQAKLQTPYSCFMSFSDNQHLLSFSPEQFIAIQNKSIETKPIKGTITNTGSIKDIDKLKNSKKNQAENIMIVDLLRNDLGKVCKSHSVNVPELLKVETYKNVHHLVSHIKGMLKDEVSELDAFLSCFPGGSITGAPKIRAMEIIAKLEKHPREAYCGSVFYLDQDGHFDSNILIRSVVKNDDKLYCWAGGGIVADSELHDEYKESLTKVNNITGIVD